MKQLFKNIALVAIIAALSTGCAVKNTDSTADKVLKHTANSPLYFSMAVGIAVVGTTNMVLDAIIPDSVIEDIEEEKRKKAEAALRQISRDIDKRLAKKKAEKEKLAKVKTKKEEKLTK